MAKVLEGNYVDKRGRKEIVPGWMDNQQPSAFMQDAVKRMMEYKPDLTERAEQLKERLQGG